MSVRKVLFAPSVLGADPLKVGEAIDSLGGSFDWLHLDIMDGRFVPNISFGPAMVSALRGRYPDAFLDVHLMLDGLDVMLPAFLESGASLITLHAEVETHLLLRRLAMIREAGLKCGVALSPATPVDTLRCVLDAVDLVMVMSVTPGFCGQTFIAPVLEKTRDLVRWREVSRYGYLIEMDGGIGRDNADAVVRAGADVIVMGSAVFGSPDPGAYLTELKGRVWE